MNKSLQKLMSNVIAVVMLVTSVFSGSVFTYAENNDVTLADAAEPTGTVWTIGDSTVCEYTSENVESYNYRQGWGMRLGDYFNSKTTVKNIAKSGRSVRDFRVYEGGKYYTDFKENLKAELKKGVSFASGIINSLPKKEREILSSPNKLI